VSATPSSARDLQGVKILQRKASQTRGGSYGSRVEFYECGVSRDTGAGATISGGHISTLVEMKSATQRTLLEAVAEWWAGACDVALANNRGN
jgi:hypothetical protein